MNWLLISINFQNKSKPLVNTVRADLYLGSKPRVPCIMCHYQFSKLQDWNPGVHYFRKIWNSNFIISSEKGQISTELLALVAVELFQAVFKICTFQSAKQLETSNENVQKHPKQLTVVAKPVTENANIWSEWLVKVPALPIWRMPPPARQCGAWLLSRIAV